MPSIKNAQIPLRSFAFRPISFRPTFPHPKKPSSVSFSRAFFLANPKRFKISRSIGRASVNQNVVKSDSQDGIRSCEEDERPPFDLNLAVVLAGFAFEAYTSPPENVGWREVDAADCQTVFLSEPFVHEVYDGQLFMKLKKGVDLPAMDPWIHSKKRYRLEVKRLNDLVYVQFNAKMKDRKKGKEKDSIISKEINNAREWLDDGPEGEEVFPGEGLTWDMVTKATEAEEHLSAKRSTRSTQAGTSATALFPNESIVQSDEESEDEDDVDIELNDSSNDDLLDEALLDETLND